MLPASALFYAMLACLAWTGAVLPKPAVKVAALVFLLIPVPAIVSAMRQVLRGPGILAILLALIGPAVVAWLWLR